MTPTLTSAFVSTTWVLVPTAIHAHHHQCDAFDESAHKVHAIVLSVALDMAGVPALVV